MIKSHSDGKLCELYLEEHLWKLGFWVFKPIGDPSPADFIAVSPSGDIFLLDSKKDSFRVNPHRKTPTRIHRVLSPVQKLLGVRMAYVNMETREVTVVPPLYPPAKKKKHNKDGS